MFSGTEIAWASTGFGVRGRDPDTVTKHATDLVTGSSKRWNEILDSG